MEVRSFDWKDVANAQFDKAMALALVLVLFGVMVTPKVDVKKQKFAIESMVAVELPPDEMEKIKPPEDIVKPVVDIVISDIAAEGASDPEMAALLQQQLGTDIFNSTVRGRTNDEADGKPFDFVPYEDPPEPIVTVRPEYPEFAKRMKIQGTVVLDVDVYKDGSVGNIKVKKSILAGSGGLDEAAVNAVKKWKFQPGKSGGKAVDTTVTIPLEFTLTAN